MSTNIPQKNWKMRFWVGGLIGVLEVVEIVKSPVRPSIHQCERFVAGVSIRFSIHGDACPEVSKDIEP